MNKNITEQEIEQAARRLLCKVSESTQKMTTYIPIPATIHRAGMELPEPVEHPFVDSMIAIQYRCDARRNKRSFGTFYHRFKDEPPKICMYCSNIQILYHEMCHYADAANDTMNGHQRNELVAEFGSMILCELTNKKYDFSACHSYLHCTTGNKHTNPKLAARLQRLLPRIINVLLFLVQFLKVDTAAQGISYVWVGANHYALAEPDMRPCDIVTDYMHAKVKLCDYQGIDKTSGKRMYSYQVQ